MKILYNTATATATTHPYPRQDELPVVGLSPDYEVFDLVETPVPIPDSEDEYAMELPAVVDTTAKTVTRVWQLVRRTVPPVSVTMRSFRRALGPARFAELMSFVSAIPDPVQRFEAETYIQHSPTVVRNHPLVAQIAAELDKPDDEIDAVFAAAQQLDQATT